MQSKSTLLILSLAFIIQKSISQTNTTILKLTGTINNAEDKLIRIGFDRSDGIFKQDTVLLDEKNSFRYKTDEIKNATLAYIFINNIQFHNFLLAPGYDINITANAYSDSTLKQSIEFSGIGAAVNSFRKNEIKYIYKPSNPLWNYKPFEDFLPEFEKIKSSQDSIITLTFTPETLIDPWANEFKKLLGIHFYFLNAEYVFGNILENKYDETKAHSIIEATISSDFFERLYNEENKATAWHQSFLNSTYIEYLKMIDEQKEPGITKKKGYTLNRIYNTYKEPFREKTMYDVMEFSMYVAKDLSRLKRIDSSFRDFYPLLKEPFASRLKNYYDDRENFLLSTQTGNKAPFFIGKNLNGNAYTPENFKGKILYIDFWASWCGPCRRETPFLKQLYDSLKGHKDFAMLSIAVSDQKPKWEKASLEENIIWESILDLDNTSKTNYFTGNGIPKFVLINRDGNIVNFNAPSPSDGMDNLIKIIRGELERAE
jgi:thiol-disulfide isomerase/thioredoxin